MKYSLDEAERLAYVYPTPANLAIFLDVQYDYLQELTKEDWEGQCKTEEKRANEAEDRVRPLEEDLQNMETERDDAREALTVAEENMAEAADMLDLLGVLPDLVARLRQS
jgi:septal ring factor EnvC (AmiA/AmiB activator)